MSNLAEIKKEWVVLLVIILLSFLVRFHNFSNRINFGPEQAISLTVSGNYLKEKWSLLGEENVQRVTSFGHRIFHPPIFNYSLVPLILIFNYDPVLITVYFTLLNIVTGFILYLVVKKILNIKVATFALILFLFNSTMIYHSLYIWNQNYIPLVNILIGYFLYQIWKKKLKVEKRNCLVIGLLTGFCVGVEFLYFLTTLVVFGLIVVWSKSKLISVMLFIGGFSIALSPMIVFDIKHQFYFLQTLFQYSLDTINSPGQGSLSYYHFLQFWPLLALIGGLMVNFLYKKQKYVAWALIFIYVGWNLLPFNTSWTQSKGMSPNLTVLKVDQAARAIALDNPNNFNVAALLDFDSRAHPLRYFLKFRYGLNPQGVEQYQNLESLYVLARSGYNFNKAGPYEINAYRPFEVLVLTRVDNDYTVYKLKKSN